MPIVGGQDSFALMKHEVVQVISQQLVLNVKINPSRFKAILRMRLFVAASNNAANRVGSHCSTRSRPHVLLIVCKVLPMKT